MRAVKKSSSLRRRLRRDGFTIAEVVMAMFVMAFAITTSITVMQRALASLDTARNISISAQIIQHEIERMRLLDWTTVNAYDTNDTVVDIDSGYSTAAAISDRFTLKRRRTLVHAGMNEITYTVEWRTYDGRTLSRSLSTYYGQNGLYDYVYSES